MQGDPAHASCRQAGVRHLERHPDRQRQVREVAVVGGLAAEVDAALGLAVVEARVAEGVHRVHRRPRERDAHHGQQRQQAAIRSGRGAGLREREPHHNKAGGARGKQDALGGDG